MANFPESVTLQNCFYVVVFQRVTWWSCISPSNTPFLFTSFTICSTGVDMGVDLVTSISVSGLSRKECV